MKNLTLMVQISTNANARDSQVASVLKQLIDAGLADAAETVRQGEGDVETAELATSLNISAPVVLSTYALDGKCHNAQPGTYGHECGKPATWIGEKTGGFTSGFCDACKQDGFEARPVKNWHKLETPAAAPAPAAAKLRVILAGSLRHGFAIHAIVNEDDVEDKVINLLLSGTLADDLEVQDPGKCLKGWQPTPNGTHFAVASDDVCDGLKVYGPFGQAEDAHAFVEESGWRPDGPENWTCLAYTTTPSKEGVPA